MTIHRSEYGYSGFTLIEIIVTILLIAFLAGVFVPFIGTSVIYSGDPVNTARQEAEMERIMEEITLFYVKEMNASPDTCLANLCATYNTNATIRYIDFTPTGAVDNEYLCAGPTTDTLKVTVETPQGMELTGLFTNARTQDDQTIVFY